MAKTSKTFVADLPELSGEQLEKLYAWGKSTCEQFDVHLQAAGGSMALVAVRKKPGTAREHQRNLRTLLQNWGVNLPAKQAGWLRLVNESACAECKSPQSSDEVVAFNATPDGYVSSADGSTIPAPSDMITRQTCSARLELPKNLLTSRSIDARLCRAA